MTNAMTATELAGALGKSRQTIYRWVGDGMPRRKDGAFDLPAVIAWLIQRERNTTACGPDCKCK